MAWAVVATTTGAERKAIADLAGAGVDVSDIYVPTVETLIEAKRGTLTEPWEPAFPGYLFVRLAPGPVPCEGHVIGTVTQSVIDEIRGREDRNGIIRRRLSRCQRRRLRAGQRVRPILDSFLSGLVGEIVKMDEQGRVTALFALMGRQTPVKIRETMLTVV